MRTESRWRALLWADVSEEVGARTATTHAAYACWTVAAFTTLFAILQVMPLPALLDAFLFGVLGFGVYATWRAAAVAALLLYVAEQGMVILQGRIGSNLILMVIFVGILLGGVRGSFSLARLRRIPPPLPGANAGQPQAN